MRRFAGWPPLKISSLTSNDFHPEKECWMANFLLDVLTTANGKLFRGCGLGKKKTDD
jgi:hypothetical protein